jgi:hypothetical protein
MGRKMETKENVKPGFVNQRFANRLRFMELINGD